MHSSRMHTDCCSGYHWMSVLGGLWPRGSLSKGISDQIGGLCPSVQRWGLCPEMRPPPVVRQTPVKTLPSLVVGKNVCVDVLNIRKGDLCWQSCCVEIKLYK